MQWYFYWLHIFASELSTLNLLKSCSIFYQEMTSSAVFLKDANLQPEASFEADFCMLEWEYLLVKQDVATCHSLSFLLQENGNLLFFLHFCLPRQMSLVAEKRNYKQILYHLVGELAPVCFPSKRGTRGLGILICMQSWKSSSLATSPFPYSLTLLNLCPFRMHPSLSLLTFMRLV